MYQRLVLAVAAVFVALPSNACAELKAGAARVDITPIKFPVFVNGGMTSRSVDVVSNRLHARAIVLDDGEERIAIVVVDSCMVPRPLQDEAKLLASQRTKIKPDRMLISATHTHTAPASMGCLGTEADPTYVPYLREKLAETIAAAEKNLEPAQVGFAVKNAAAFTALRRWIIRPDRVTNDPFGNPTVRATMHAGSNWDNVTGESGPEDPDLSLISVQATDGRPIAVLANFSMHYFSGETGLSADYFGRFCAGLEERLARPQSKEHQEFVGLMSHGCSGDIWRRDYKKPSDHPENTYTIESYTEGLLNVAMQAYESIEHDGDADLAMAEQRMQMNYRVPDAQRLEWAKRIVEATGDRLPKDGTEVYAREQVILHELQSTEIVVQAIRIGDIGITTTPNETYALTGLKLKLQSPLANTIVIELANGGDGYIPPPEQHHLGGYNTWAARSAGLEVQAEPKITEAGLSLLERVSGTDRRAYQQTRGAGVDAILALKPVAYWRMDEFDWSPAIDSSGNDRDASYEAGVAFFLDGPHSEVFCKNGETNRTAHFAGGRMRTRLSNIVDEYSVALWFWNGMPAAGRGTAGWMFSRGRNAGLGNGSDHVGLGGIDTAPGKLIYQAAGGKPSVGRTAIERWSWNHLAFMRGKEGIVVFLNGKPDVTHKFADNHSTSKLSDFFFGGRSDNDSNWEGRLDEIAVFDRALTPSEVQRLAK